MSYEVTTVWYVPNGNFNNTDEIWASRTSAWSPAQKAAAEAINDQYVQSASMTWDDVAKTVTTVALFANRADCNAQNAGWHNLFLQTSSDWQLVSSNSVES